MPSTLAFDRRGASSRRALLREARPPWVGEVTLSQELRTAGLLRSHVLVGYQWSHTGLRPGRKISHNRYIRSFVSQPPLNQADPPCSFPPWLPGPRQGWAAGSDRFWLLELRVSRTFLYQLQPQLFRELIHKSMYCKYLRHSSDRFWLLELRVSRTFLDFLRPQLLSMCSTGGMLP